MKAKPKSNVLSMHRPSVAKDSQKKETTFEEQEARLNVTLPVSLHQAVKVAAAKRGQTIRALIMELLKKEGIRA